MTVSTTTNKISYTASGSQDTFDYNFKIFSEDDLLVYVRVSQTDILKTNYTVTGVGNDDGGNIVFISPYKPSSGETVTIIRSMDIVQETDYVPNDPFPAETHEDALDYRTMIEQQLNEQIGRQITVPITDQATDLELPNEEVRASRYLIFDSDGNVTVSLTTISGGSADHGVLAGLLDDDHPQYLLASQATDRAAFTAGWTGLTDGGNTTLHIHDSRYYTESEVDALHTTINNTITSTSGTLQSQIDALDTGYATDAELASVSGSLYAGYVAADTTLSGILVSYVDSEILTLSGSIVLDHGGLTGLGDDDHTQYLLRTDFTTYSGAIVAGYTAADTSISGALQSQLDALSFDHGDLTGLGDDDHTQYLLRTDFTTSSGDIVSQIPSLAGYATESYVDTVSGTLAAQSRYMNFSGDYVYNSNNFNGTYIEDSGIEENNGLYTPVYTHPVSGQYRRSYANDISTMPCTGLTLTTSSGGNPPGYPVLLDGIVYKSEWESLAKGPVYLSVSGTITDNPPTTSGTYLQILGVHLDAGVIHFSPELNTSDITVSLDTANPSFSWTDLANGEYSGLLQTDAVLSSPNSHGNCLTLTDFSGASKYVTSNASSLGVSNGEHQTTAMAVGNSIGVNDSYTTGIVLLQGFVRNDNWNWNIGDSLYVGDSYDITSTPLTASGTAVVAIGKAMSADVIYFNPSMFFTINS